MKCVLVTVHSGIVSDVEFFDDPAEALKELAMLTKSMNVDKEDAAVFSPSGLVADAKGLFDWYDQVSGPHDQATAHAA